MRQCKNQDFVARNRIITMFVPSIYDNDYKWAMAAKLNLCHLGMLKVNKFRHSYLNVIS